MDCSNARLLMQFRTTSGDELAAPEREELDAHLAGCPLCRALDHDQHRLDEHLGRAMRDVPVPAGLRQRLLAAVAPAPPAKRPRRWVKRAGWGLGLATAASLGLLVWAWYFGQGPLKPTISPHQVQMGYLATLPRDPDAVNAQFRVLGARLCAPDWVEYKYLSNPPSRVVLPGYTNEKDAEKYKVPQLIFTRRVGREEEEVKMFILHNRAFRVEDYEPAYYEGYNLAVHTAPYYTYLMLYKGKRGWDWIKRSDADW
jgi:hypothetical protein